MLNSMKQEDNHHNLLGIKLKRSDQVGVYDQYFFEDKSPLSTKDVTVFVDHDKGEITGDCVAYGSWFDIDEAECLKYLQELNEEDVLRDYKGYLKNNDLAKTLENEGISKNEPSEYLIDIEEIEAWMEDEGYEFADDIEETLFILPDGQMISGGYEMGVRGEDHIMIESLMDSDRYDVDFWSKVHDQTGIVRYVPETNVGLIATDQKLTNQQLNILEDAGATIESYCRSLNKSKQNNTEFER